MKTKEKSESSTTKVDQLFIVEANFDSPDSTWWRTIGFFSNRSEAEEICNKWKRFFDNNKNFFCQPMIFDGKTYEDFHGNQHFESWYESDEYSRLILNFGDLKYFKKISIRKSKINRDIFIETSKFDNSEQMIKMMNQWDRDYKLGKLL